MFMPFEKLAGVLEDEQLYDDALQSYFQRALVELDHTVKELRVLEGFTRHRELLTRVELERIKCTSSVTISEQTTCDVC